MSDEERSGVEATAREIAATILHALDEHDYTHPDLTARAFLDAVERIIAPEIAAALRAAPTHEQGLGSSALTGARSGNDAQRLTVEGAATMVVEFVLDYVERAGRISGGNGRRVLELSGGSLNMQTGAITPHVETITRDVRKILSGEATYTKKNAGAFLPAPSKRRASAK